MRSRLRRFAVVGILATAIDLGAVVLVFDLTDSQFLWAANVVALTAASVFAYVANRSFTFRRDPEARWVSQPALFFSTAVLAGALDTAVLLALHATTDRLVVDKLIAIFSAAVLRWVVYRWILFGVVRQELGERIERPLSPGRYRLSVVLPAFEESARIGDTVRRLRDALTPVVGDDLQILVVDDGSTDDTAGVAERAGADVLRQDENRGKGAAVRAGVIAAGGRTVVFTDADLAYPPRLVAAILTEVENGWDVVVGSRRHEDAITLARARWLRELGGWLVNWLTHLVLLGHFRDTQCGLKGFRGDIGRVIFERCRVDGFAFDVEVFLIAEQDRLSLKEVPVSVENRQGSTVRLVRDTLVLLKDLIRIRRAAGWGWYRPDPSQQQVLGRRIDPGGAVPPARRTESRTVDSTG